MNIYNKYPGSEKHARRFFSKLFSARVCKQQYKASRRKKPVYQWRNEKRVESIVRGLGHYTKLLSLCGVIHMLSFSAAKAELPVACTGSCSGGNPAWLTPIPGMLDANRPSFSTVGNVMNINMQKVDRAIMNWQTFNIGRNNTVNFNQKSSSSIALNRIWDPQARPSDINGKLNANGQVYIINRNGIIFGKNSQVNVHSLVASALDINDDLFINSNIAEAISQGLPAFEHDGVLYGLLGDAEIELLEGAQITTANGGRVMIFAPMIKNGGKIVTPEGQTILAASSSKVFLIPSKDDSLRGFKVEVDMGGDVDVTNLGQIIAERGNITLMGFAINQKGLLSASTSVDLNGSIRLLARHGAKVGVAGNNVKATSTEFGGKDATVTFGENSVTQILPELDDITAAIDGQLQPLSELEVMAKKIIMDIDSQIFLPGGEVSMVATVHPDRVLQANTNTNESAITMREGSVIDVSGTENTVLEMARNLVSVELRANELADSPLQRNGVLRGETIIVDVREGTPLAIIDGAISNIKRSVSERLAKGGTVTLRSEGAVDLKLDSSIDVSGGFVKFNGGKIKTTQLQYKGKVIDISKADPNLVYDGIFGQQTEVHEKWGQTETWILPGIGDFSHFEQGYKQGKDAGTITLRAPNLSTDGDMLANVVQGEHQRNKNQTPEGGKLVFDLTQGRGGRSGAFIYSGELSQLVIPESLNTPATISTELFSRGVNQVEIRSNGAITVGENASVNLAAGGSFGLDAVGDITVLGDIHAQAGDVVLDNRRAAGERADIHIGEDSQILLHGQWVNDNPTLHDGAPSDPLLIDGGNIEIIANGDVIMERGSEINVGSGGWLTSTDELVGGNGGDVSIKTTFNLGSNMQLDGHIHGEALAKGGELNITANAVCVGNAGCSTMIASVQAGGPGVFAVDSNFFQQGGFTSYQLNANLGIDTLDDSGNPVKTAILITKDDPIHPKAFKLQLDNGFRRRISGSDINEFSRVLSEREQPELDRDVADIGFTVKHINGVSNDFGMLVMEQGARIETDVLANVNLRSDSSLYINGRILAPAGEINLSTTVPGNSVADARFVSNQAIWLGSRAELNTAAQAQLIVNEEGLRSGNVYDAGEINITANRGYLVIESGAKLDVSGIAQQLDFTGINENVDVEIINVAASAGNIRLASAEGMFIDGELSAQRAPIDGAEGGGLEIVLDSNLRQDPDVNDTSFRPFPITERMITIVENERNTLPEDLKFGQLASDAFDEFTEQYNGQVILSASKVERGGFDSLSVRVKAPRAHPAPVIAFAGDDVSLSMRRSIILDAPIIRTDDASHVSIESSYVAIGSTLGGTSFFRGSAAPMSGSGQLMVQADLIDLVGTTSTQGFNNIALNSHGDIRLRGIFERANNSKLTGFFATTGEFTLKANQLYPSTHTSFNISSADYISDSVEDPAIQLGVITVLPGENAATPVLSAAGNLTLVASRIEQLGVVKAPLGEINLQATEVILTNVDGDDAIVSGSGEIVLGANSITSTSSDGQTILFGQTDSSGSAWINPYALNRQELIEAPPESVVNLKGRSIDTREGAVIDISGGGDLLAYEFINGPGGTFDVLDANAARYNGSFAVLPAFESGFTPYDQTEFPQSGLQIGDNVYLSGIDGLPAGEYVMLPPHYALLDGAYLVTPFEGAQNIRPGDLQQRIDGASVIAGKYSVAGTEIRDSLWSGFVVEPGEIVHTRSKYILSSANQFFTDLAIANETVAPILPQDAGRLTIQVSDSLKLGATLKADVDVGGFGSQVDIVADNIVIGKNDPQSEGKVFLRDDRLNALGANSLLIGATREQTENGIRLSNAAQTIEVQSGSDIEIPDVMLLASDTIVLRGGASVNGTGDALVSGRKIAIQGDGAFVRVSAGAQMLVDRTSTTGSRGTINIESAAVVQADRSITLDASKRVINDGSIVMENGSLQLGAERISLGEVPASTPGLILSNANLSQLQLNELILNTRSTVDIYGDVDLGLNTSGDIQTENLVIQGAGIAAYNSSGLTRITANNITLANSNKRLFSIPPAAEDQSVPTAGTGELSIHAGRFDSADVNADGTSIDGVITLGEGDTTIRGFSSVVLQGDKQIVGDAQGSLSTDADITLRAARITTSAGAITEITSTGGSVVTTNTGVSAAALTTIESLGGSLKISGESVLHNGTIVMPSGSVTFVATGGGAQQDVVFSSGSVTDVAGITKTFSDQQVASTGGRVIAESAQGDVILAQGSTINLAGGEVSTEDGLFSYAAAGSLHLSAQMGTAQIEGELLAGASNDAAGASFKLDVHHINDAGVVGDDVDDFDHLAQTLLTAGFDEAIDVRVRSGDIIINNSQVVAHQVKLTADAGGITLEGVAGLPGIDARGDDGGKVVLNARDHIIFTENAIVDASAVAVEGDGGDVFLGVSADNSSIQFAQGARIDVSAGASSDEGSQPGKVGHVAFRLSRSSVNTLLDADASNDLLALNGEIVGSDRTILEGFATYSDDIISDADVLADVTNVRYQDAQQFMQQAQVITDALGKNTDSTFHVTPGIEIVSDNDLTLAADWDLAGWRFNGEPGILTLRAGANLKINQDLTDGFRDEDFVVDVDTNSTFPLTGVPQQDDSWSYRLVAGADYTSSDPLSVVKENVADNTSGNIKINSGVKVRTGTGDIDIVASNDLELLGKDSVIYTAGLSDGFGEISDFFANFLFRAYYPVDGGDLNISVGGDIDSQGSDQFISQWYSRIGSAKDRVDTPTAWGIEFEKFEQNIGALGGGDVNLIVGGNINNLSVMLPTNGKQVGETEPGFGVPVSISNEVLVENGGDLLIDVAGDINSGIFYVGNGQATIRSGGSLSKTNSQNFYPILVLAEGGFDIQANRDISLEAAINPTVLAQPVGSVASTVFFTYGENSQINLNSLSGDINFLNRTSEIDDNNKNNGLPLLSGTALNVYPGILNATAMQGTIGLQGSMIFFPSSQGELNLLAADNLLLSANINFSDADPTVLPSVASPHTNYVFAETVLDLLSRNGTDLNDEFFFAKTPVHVNDDEPVRLVAQNGSINPPGSSGRKIFLSKRAELYAGLDIGDLELRTQHTNVNDVTRIEAGRDILFKSERNKGNIVVNQSVIEVAGPGRVDIIAGRDINLGASDGVTTVGDTQNPALSSISNLGADINLMAGVPLDLSFADFNAQYIMYHAGIDGFVLAIDSQQAAGIGSLSSALQAYDTLTSVDQEQILISAAIDSQDLEQLRAIVAFDQDFDALTQQVQQTTNNSALSDLAVADYILQSDIEQQQQLAQSLDMGVQAMLQTASIVEYQESVRTFISQRNNPMNDSGAVVSVDQALAQFVSLDRVEQRPLVFNAFYNEIREAGVFAVTNDNDDYTRGFRAVNSLFPSTQQYQGDLISFFSRIYTQDGGDINIMVPGGLVNAGLASTGNIIKNEDQLGIVAQRTGDVSAFVDGDILVNVSRIFALDGGNMLLWSSNGDIDAGRGAKTAIASPPPQVSFDSDGNVVIEPVCPVSGSGIRSGICTPDREPGNIFLVAPRGVIRASDAGIGTLGNLTVAATEVLGSDNIDVGGASVGVPVADTGSLAAGLTGVSNLSSNVSNTEGSLSNIDQGGASDSPLADDALSFLEVEVLGLGDENDKSEEDKKSDKK